MMSCAVMSCAVMSCAVMSCAVMSCAVMSFAVTSYTLKDFGTSDTVVTSIENRVSSVAGFAQDPDLRPSALVPRPSLRPFRADQIEERSDEVHRQRKNNGGILVGGDHGQRFEVAELDRLGLLRKHPRGL